MLEQEAMIARVRALCLQDERLVGALQYGSFARGEADAFSDIEFALFFADAALARVDQRTWVEQIAPVALFFADEFGHHTAIFANLVRGEFHFNAASTMAKVEAWRGNAWFPSLAATLIVDRSGELTRYLQPLIGAPPPRDTPETVQALVAGFVNGVLFGTNVLARGETARAVTILDGVRRHLLWMARLVEGTTEHWPTPEKGLEGDLSPAGYARYAACVAPLDREAVWDAYATAWTWGQLMARVLLARHQLTAPDDVLHALERRLAELRVTG